MSRMLVSLLAFGLVLLCPSLAAAAPALARPDASDAFFAGGQIPHLIIEVTGTNLANLRRNDREYVRATIREGATVYADVGLHVKGAAGSNRGFDDHPALTLNFDKFKDGQQFHGMDKLHLNNSVQDRSYLTEDLCAGLFLEAGVPAARIAHVLVTLNGKGPRLYVLKEGFDKQFLRRHFRSASGNLYDGGFLREITEGIERTSGSGRNTRADLALLAAAAQEPDLKRRLVRLEQVLDVDRFLSFTALEIITDHWDGYARKKNNYRIYHDPSTDKMVFMPHGMDQMFWDGNSPVVFTMPGLVAQALMEIPEGKRRYRERVSELFANVFRLEAITNRINELQSRLRPVLASISQDEARNHDNAVQDIRNKVNARVNGLYRILNQPPPTPLRFRPDGSAALTNWYVSNLQNNAELHRITEEGKPVLHIKRLPAETRGSPSWRCRVTLGPGQYRFEGRGRCAEVTPMPNTRQGEGGGLRVSGSKDTRVNKLVGTLPWTDLAYDFTRPEGEDEVTFVCELLATQGEVWFDLASLKLRKLE